MDIKPPASWFATLLPPKIDASDTNGSAEVGTALTSVEAGESNRSG